MLVVTRNSPSRRRIARLLGTAALGLALGLSASGHAAAQTAAPAPAISAPSTSALATIRADHVLLGVADFGRGVAWYVDKLGFKVEKRWTVDALPGMELAYLELNGFRVEIIGGGGGQRLPVPATFGEHLRLQGYQHLCFTVSDVDQVMAELRSRGVEAFVPAESYSNVGVRVAFIKDPEGNVIEFSGPIPASK